MELSFESHGESGDPLIILHGLLGSKDNWRGIARTLGDRLRVFLLDQRNHGHAPHSLLMDYPAMAEDVREFISKQGLAPAHVLGHSMGAKTAMQLALNHPGEVRSLISVDMAPRSYSPRHREMIDALLSLDLGALRSRQEVDAGLESTIPDISTRRFLVKNVQRAADGSLRWRIGLREISQNYEHLRRSVEGSEPYPGPALFVRGESSDYLVEGDLPEIHRWFPSARLKTIPSSDHLPHVQNPTALQQVLLEFLPGAKP